MNQSLKRKGVAEPELLANVETGFPSWHPKDYNFMFGTRELTVTRHSIRGLTTLIFQHCPLFSMVYGRAHWQGTSICSPITWQPTAFLASTAESSSGSSGISTVGLAHDVLLLLDIDNLLFCC